MKIRLLLVDDHKILREGIKRILEPEDDFIVVGEAGDGSAAVTLTAQCFPDVVVMDLCMPKMNGIEATRHIVAASPAVRVLVLSMSTDAHFGIEALQAGAHGFLGKDCSEEELKAAIRSVSQGKHHLCTKITDLVVSDYLCRARGDVPAGHRLLTRREKEVLLAIADGKSTKEIAFDFKVSIKTIEAQRQNIMKKLHLFTIADLIKFAVREGLTGLG